MKSPGAFGISRMRLSGMERSPCQSPTPTTSSSGKPGGMFHTKQTEYAGYPEQEKAMFGWFKRRPKSPPHSINTKFAGASYAPTKAGSTSAPSKSADDDFGTSMMIGYATDNALLGGAIGGNFVGGMIGQALADSTHSTPSPSCDTSSSYSAPDTSSCSSSSSFSGC